MHQNDAYPQIEITNLRRNNNIEKVVNAVNRYGEQYFQVRGEYPPRISVSRRDYATLTKNMPKASKPVWRGIPIVVPKGW